ESKRSRQARRPAATVVTTLKRETVRELPAGAVLDAVGGGAAVGLHADRDQACAVADVAHVELNAPGDFSSELVLIADPQIDGVFRIAAIRMIHVDQLGRGVERVAENFALLPAVGGAYAPAAERALGEVIARDEVHAPRTNLG